MSATHKFRLIITSSATASMYVMIAIQRGINPVRHQIVPSEIILTPAMRRA